MSDAESRRFDAIKARLREAVGDGEGEVDFESIRARLRESAERAGQDVDVDAFVARARDAIGSVEGKINAGTIRSWINDVDKDTVQGWMGGARTAAAGAASFAAAQGERLAERAPGALDKVIGVAKEAIGDLTDNQDLARQGELQHLKGDIESRFAEAETEATDAADAARAKLEGTAG